MTTRITAKLAKDLELLGYKSQLLRFLIKLDSRFKPLDPYAKDKIINYWRRTR